MSYPIINIHPGIRIVCFLVLMAFLARADFQFIIVAFLVFPFLAFRQFSSVIKRTWHFAVRLRWFWLSIILLYSLMTPGDFLLSFTDNLGVSINGVIAGVERILGLLLVLLYFSLLILTIDENKLQGAIYWILGPLQYLGVSVEKISLRISLTLRATAQLQKLTEKMDKQQTDSKRKWLHLSERLSAMLNQTLHAAQNECVENMELEYTRPDLVQWLYPAALSGLFWAINSIRF